MANTYWQYDQEYTREDGTRGSCIGPGGETQETALAAGIESATYYLGFCRYPEARVIVREFCNACHGEGEIETRRPRSTQRKRCAACRGHRGPLNTIGPVPVSLATNVVEKLDSPPAVTSAAAELLRVIDALRESNVLTDWPVVREALQPLRAAVSAA